MIEPLEMRALLATVQVSAVVETESISGADDPAIWIHPTDPSRSTIIGTNKTSSNGLRVYDLNGNQIQSVSSETGNANNVDVRYGFPLDGNRVDLVAASIRANNSISIFSVNPTTGQLQNVAARTIDTGISVYGFSMYHSAATDKFYALVNSKSGQVQQWELFDNGSGRVDATHVRSFDVGSRVEGMVVDDALGHLYVSEEEVGIWKYDAEPDSGSSRTQVDAEGGNLSADIEGLTIYYADNGGGYLLASSQGSNEFVVYQRQGNNSYVGTFEIVSGNGLDSVSNTDGIDVTNVAVGPNFPQGVFVAQDDDVNYKLVPWQSIAQSFEFDLTIDTDWDPRGDAVPAASAQNPVLRQDVNDDGTVSAIDALIVINQIDENLSVNHAQAAGITSRYYLDVNGDDKVSAADALQVINFLARQSRSVSSQGELVAVRHVPSDVSKSIDSQSSNSITLADFTSQILIAHAAGDSNPGRPDTAEDESKNHDRLDDEIDTLTLIADDVSRLVKVNGW